MAKGLWYWFKLIGGVAGVVIVLAVVCLGSLVVYGYVQTTTDTWVIVPPAEIPSGAQLGPRGLANSLQAGFFEIERGRTEQLPPAVTQAGLLFRSAGIQATLPPTRVASPTLPPIKIGSSGVSTEVSLEALAGFGAAWKADWHLELGVTGVRDGGYRLEATLKKRPDFRIMDHWKEPADDRPCPSFDSCVQGLVEQIAATRYPKSLANYYAKRRDRATAAKLVALYGRIPAASLSLEDRLSWGQAFVILRDYPSALQKFRETLQYNSQFCRALESIGFVHLQQFLVSERSGDLEQAEKAFREALRCNPASPEAHNSLGNAVMRKWTLGGQKDKALATEAQTYFLRALNQKRWPVPLVNLAYLAYRQGRTQDALQMFEKAATEFPENERVFLNYGFTLYREFLKGRAELKVAIDKTKRAVQINPESDVGHQNLGFFYYEASMWKESLEHFQRSVELNNQNWDTWAGYALALHRNGDEAKALDAFKRAALGSREFLDPQLLGSPKYNWGANARRDVVVLIEKLQAAAAS